MFWLMSNLSNVICKFEMTSQRPFCSPSLPTLSKSDIRIKSSCADVIMNDLE